MAAHAEGVGALLFQAAKEAEAETETETQTEEAVAAATQSKIRGAQKEKVTYSKRLEWSNRSHLPELGTAATTERERERKREREQETNATEWPTGRHATPPTTRSRAQLLC